MATLTKSPKTTKAPAKVIRASRKQAPTHETHGALPSRQPMNMIKAFGIRDGYTVDTLEDYTKQLEGMIDSELHDHAHTVGIVPLDPRDKLTASLLRKFTETKMAQRPPRNLRVQTNPEMSTFMKRFMAGELS